MTLDYRRPLLPAPRNYRPPENQVCVKLDDYHNLGESQAGRGWVTRRPLRLRWTLAIVEMARLYWKFLANYSWESLFHALAEQVVPIWTLGRHGGTFCRIKVWLSRFPEDRSNGGGGTRTNLLENRHISGGKFWNHATWKAKLEFYIQSSWEA